MRLIELHEGFFVNPDHVAVVKVAGKLKCSLYTPGQSATDGGFLVPYAAEEVAQQINDAIDEGYSDEGDGSIIDEEEDD
jgi:hypothetical protein